MLEHGGNLQQACIDYQRPLDAWLDLSTGISPYIYPVPAIDPALWHRLPIENDGLLEAARRYYQQPHVLAVAGSQAAIQALPQARPPSRVLVLGPAYAEHAHAWRKHGHTVTERDTLPDADELHAVDVLVVCNPNNPTGRLCPPAQLLAWRQSLAPGAWLIVDEAFMDATPEYSISAQAAEAGLIVLRSLGKFFGLAGARVGMVLAAPELLDQLREWLGPWTLSGPARLIATTAMNDADWQQAQRRRLMADMASMHAVLEAAGISPDGSTPLFSYWSHARAAELHIHLATHGIWTRLFASPSAIRLGLPPPDGWARLQQALQAWANK
ncbi:MAG TPA: threonine-phosphate decarboxylase CobD [Methylovorus sp.]|nr:threonine-phosphate decarboxylase CobD [Methylovorus sp.]